VTASAIAIVLASALMHALWNLYYKRSRDGSGLFLLATTIQVVILLPIFAYLVSVHGIPRQGIVFVVSSSVLQGIYLFLLARAFRAGEMSLVYPIARSAPVLVAIWGALFLGERLASLGIVGVILSVAGVWFIEASENDLQARGNGRRRISLAVWLALVTAFVISIYSIVDKLGISFFAPKALPPSARLGGSLVYAYLTFVILGLTLAAGKGTRLMKLGSLLKAEWRWAVIIALLSLLSYFLLIFVLSFSSVTYAVSVRQASIIFGVLLGGYRLRESKVPMRLAASVVIAAGLVLIGVAK
jgi:drug/metabolite transporter (DMT)-like permease